MRNKLFAIFSIVVAVAVVAIGRAVVRSNSLAGEIDNMPLVANRDEQGGGVFATGRDADGTAMFSGSTMKLVPGAIASPLAAEPEAGFAASSAATSERRALGASWLANTGPATDAGFPGCFECFLDHECKPGKGCAINRATGHLACVTGNCAREEDCPGGWSCIRVGSERAVSRCVEHGAIGEGQTCNYDPSGPAYSCEPGLVCLNNRCALPCPGRVCKAGSVCVDSPDGLACESPKQTCHTTGCPQGLHCEYTGEDDFMCVSKVKGSNCFERPCGKGQSCQVAFGPQIVEFWCATRCDPLAPSCRSGSLCGQSHTNRRESVCYPACVDHMYCPKGQACSSISEDRQTSGCMPHPGPKPKPGSAP